MTHVTPPADPGVASAQPPVAVRPGIVTAAGITLIVLGILTMLLGLVLLIGAGLFAGAAGSIPETAEMPGVGGMFGAFAGAIFLITFIVIGFGVLQLVSGINVLGGRGWARVTGIVIAIIAGVIALAGIGARDGAVISLALVVANAFVVYALATTGSWFVPRPRA
ncbi:MAG: DUF7144 family membrane protein [Candidatus Limnocylindria bacterium]